MLGTQYKYFLTQTVRTNFSVCLVYLIGIFLTIIPVNLAQFLLFKTFRKKFFGCKTFDKNFGISVGLDSELDDTVVVYQSGKTWSAYCHNTGVVTVDHIEKYQNIDYFEVNGEAFSLTERNVRLDYRIYGSRPLIGKPRKHFTYKLGNETFRALYVGEDPDSYFAYSSIKAIRGLSGAPIFNELGEFVSVYCDSLSKTSEHVHLKKINSKTNLAASEPIVLRFPKIQPIVQPEDTKIHQDLDYPDANYPKSVTEGFEHLIKPMTLSSGVVKIPGYYELTAPLGKGKSTQFPLSYIREHERRGVLIIEPFVSLVSQLASHLNFSEHTSAGHIVRDEDLNYVITAGMALQYVRNDIYFFNRFSAIFLDEDHVELADVMTLKHFFINNARLRSLVVIAMSATHGDKYSLETNHKITDYIIHSEIEISDHLHAGMNALMFSPTTKNYKLEDVATRLGFTKIWHLNREQIMLDPGLVKKIQDSCEKTTGNYIISTRVADVGMNFNIDLVYSPDYDLTEMYELYESNTQYQTKEYYLFHGVRRCGITRATWIQRRGRVGRRKPGIFISLGDMPNKLSSGNTMEYLKYQLRLEALQEMPSNSTLEFFKHKIGFEDYYDEYIAFWDSTWTDDPLEYLSKYNTEDKNFLHGNKDRSLPIQLTQYDVMNYRLKQDLKPKVDFEYKMMIFDIYSNGGFSFAYNIFKILQWCFPSIIINNINYTSNSYNSTATDDRGRTFDHFNVCTPIILKRSVKYVYVDMFKNKIKGYVQFVDTDLFAYSVQFKTANLRHTRIVENTLNEIKWKDIFFGFVIILLALVLM